MFHRFCLFSSFIEEKSSFEYGQVNHALTAAMRTLMKEYLILVTQLEHLQRQGLLTLQKLWFYIQPTMRTMEILASIGKSVKPRTCLIYCFLNPVIFNLEGKRVKNVPWEQKHQVKFPLKGQKRCKSVFLGAKTCKKCPPGSKSCEKMSSWEPKCTNVLSLEQKGCESLRL